MKKVLIMFMAIVWTATLMGQQIAVVSENGTTSVFQTLQEAIEGASNGSVIYLPGGGFLIDDSVKITKRLTIIGIGHKAKNENADGNTTIGGNLFFNEGSSGSSIMGCYISGNVNIGEGGGSVNNVVVKYCNLNGVFVNNNTCTRTIVNQNYIRSVSDFKLAEVTFNNNICGSIINVAGANICNNIFAKHTNNGYYLLHSIYSSTIANNIVIPSNNVWGGGNRDNLISGNMIAGSNWGDDPINISNWIAVFVNINGASISPASDFHFKPEYQQYSDCGIYGGDGFSDGALPPVPFIVSKSIPEQTDASGRLNIKIRVKAGE